MRLLKWFFFTLLVTAYIYAVFFYPQTRIQKNDTAKEDIPSLEMSEVVVDSSVYEKDTVIEPVVEVAVWPNNYKYSLLSGSYETEAEAQQRQRKLNGLYVSSDLVYFNSLYCVVLIESNEYGRIKSAQADFIALGLSVTIQQN